MGTESKNTKRETLSLDGLTLAPPQVLGGVRIVPVIRENAPADLRLAKRNFDEDLNVAVLSDGTVYYSYVPHALVATWASDGKPVAKFGTEIKKNIKTKDGKRHDFGFMTARVMQKMRARETKNRLRFLPLDLAMEGFLSFHFGGPTIAWEEYSRAAISSGLSPRSEMTHRGHLIAGLEDALRVFETHENQVGSLVFVADALASVFIVPHPSDYLELHRTLITDYFGELIFQYGFFAQENLFQPAPINQPAVSSFSELRNELDRIRRDWSQMHQAMTKNLFDREVETKTSYKMGPFQMKSFMTDLNPKSENHIGEFIKRADGTIEYMKTYRLSAAQCRRAYLLKQLAECDWELAACAEFFNCTKNQIIFRIEKAGFGYLLHQHVLDEARAWARKRSGEIRKFKDRKG